MSESTTRKRTNKIATKLNDILPDRVEPIMQSPQDSRAAAVDLAAQDINSKSEASLLAKRKWEEKIRVAQCKSEEDKARAAEILENIEELETEPVLTNPVEVAKSIQESQALSPSQARALVHKTQQMQPTTRKDVTKLLTSLGINLSVQLSKQDTANLLAVLLTCNEAQLDALYKNKKLPVAIKTVIKRIQDDSKLGNIETIESIWDRIFGKGAMQLDLPQQTQLATGILPNTPISREAYVIIRDTLMK